MPTLPILDKGPAEIVWGYGESAAVYLGKTIGAVKLTMETQTSDINEDQEGVAAVNAILTGSIVEVEVPLTRLSVEQLATAINSEVVGDNIVPIRNQIGCDMYSLSKQLVIKPLCGNEISDDPATWVHIYHAYPVAGLDLTWDLDTQRIIPVKFKVFVSQESGWEGDFGTIGMESGSTEYGI